LDTYVRSGFQALQSDGEKQFKIVLRFAPEVAGVVKSKPLAHEQTIKTDKSGHVTVSFRASALFQVEREVLSWGDKVDVLEPLELRRRIRSIAKKIVRNSR
jgi:predicted DNA-binding transcriptional regulator YafY